MGPMSGSGTIADVLSRADECLAFGGKADMDQPLLIKLDL